MKILTLTSLFPNQKQPNHGVFVKNRVMAMGKFCEVKVVAPVPWVPLFKLFSKKYKLLAHIPIREIQDGVEVYHPRYLITPKIGRSLYGFMYYFSILKFMKRLYKQYEFDLLDVHWAYPDGFAGVLFANLFRRPVTITIRGTDISLYPKYFLRRKMIVYALRKANLIISVCNALKERSSEIGIEKAKITVIPNGVNIERFYPLKKNYVRNKLGLPLDREIIVSVGHLIERKGFHVIIDAVHKLVKSEIQEKIMLIIVGEGEYRKKLETQIERLKLQSFVNLTGAKLNENLVYWYNAADISCLASSREGWPNVVFESLSCGTPVVATSVWGTPEVLCSDDYGILVKEQRGDELALAISEALRKGWKEKNITEYARNNTWDRVGEKVYREFELVLNSRKDQ